MIQQPPTINVVDLCKTYRGGWFRGAGVAALRGVSFDVQPGEIFGLLGPNGAGKTTFIKILLGIVRPTGGKARLLDRPAGDRRGRRRVGYLPENLRIPRHQNALTALEFYGRLSGLSMAEIRRKRPALLETVGLAHRAQDSVRKYSKGMLQRLGLAQALLHDPDLLILDEPTDGLDPVGRSQVRTILHELKAQGKTVFLNSHLLLEVETVCDRVAILDHGHLRYVGGIDALSKQLGHAGLDVAFDLGGEETAIRAAFNGHDPELVLGNEKNRFRVKAKLADQAAVDAAIDRLRTAKISILAVEPHRMSLEDAFLGLLDQHTEKP